MSRVIRDNVLPIPLDQIAREYAWLKKVLDIKDDTALLSTIVHHVYTVMKQHDSLEGDKDD